MRVRGLLGGLGTANGTVWFDKVELVPVGNLAVLPVDASSFDASTPPWNTRDGNLDTRWSARGDGQWIRYDLGAVRTVAYVRIAWDRGALRTARFDIQTPLDGSNWSQAWSGQSSGTTAERQTFDFPDTSARYVPIVGHGNSENDWNSLTEVEIYGW